MPSVPISQLPPVSEVSPSAYVPLDQNGVTSRATVQQIGAAAQALTQSFLTVGSESGTLPNSRAAGATNGITKTDSGAGGTLTFSLTGQALNFFLLSTTGLTALTGGGGVASRSLVGPGKGFTISNADGVAGNPTFALTGGLLALEDFTGPGVVCSTGPDTFSPRTLTGTASQIIVTEGQGAGGDPTFSIADDPRLPGTAGFLPPGGTTAQRPLSPPVGFTRRNTDLNVNEAWDGAQWVSQGVSGVTSVATGTGLSGGPITSTGTISIADTGVTAGTYGDAAAVPVPTVNAQGQITSITTAAITPAAIGALTPTGDGSGLSVSDGATTKTLADWTARIDRPSSGNLAPNSAWYVMTAFDPVTMPDVAGTGTMGTISVSSYTTGSNEVTVSTSDTQGLVDGMLVRFSAEADAVMRYCTQSDGVTVNTFSLQAYDVVENTSFKVRLPLGRAPSASAACTVTMVTPGDTSGISGDGPDGWAKTSTLKLWRDVHAANQREGSAYQIGLRKGSGSAEIFACALPAQTLPLYRGRKIAFGMAVNQSVRGGSGTWRLAISDGVTLTYSDPAPASSGYQWLSVSAVIASAAASLTVWLECSGAVGDVYYVAKPLISFGETMDESAYCSSAGRIFFDRKFTPLSFNTIDYTTPSAADGLGLYSTRVGLYQETNGALTPEIRWLDAQFEGIGQPGACGTPLAIRSNELTGIKFGAAPIYCQIEGIMCAAAGSIQTDSSGSFWVYSGLPNIPWKYVSIDINGAGV